MVDECSLLLYVCYTLEPERPWAWWRLARFFVMCVSTTAESRTQRGHGVVSHPTYPPTNRRNNRRWRRPRRRGRRPWTAGAAR